MPNNRGRKFDEQRRRFLQRTLQASSAITALSGVTGPLAMRKAFAALEKMGQRRHLVTIQAVGASGWDSQSFHFAANPNFMKPEDKALTPIPENSGYQYWTPRTVTLNDKGMEQIYDVLNHPKYGNDPFFAFGPGMSIFTPSELSNDLQIWGGAYMNDGGHETSMYTFNGGLRSQYASSFSSLVSVELAKSSLRNLHYVQIGAPMQSFRGFLSGPAEPILIDDEATWNALVEIPANDPMANHQNAIMSGLSKLSEAAQASRLKLTTSKKVFGSFVDSAKAVAAVRSYGTPDKKAAFAALKANYISAMNTALLEHPYGRRHVVKYGIPFAAASVDILAFRFALAELLVTDNQAAVVDLAGFFTDAHSGNASEACMILCNYVGMRTLMNNLRALPANAGETLLDATHLSMYSEFDRTPQISYGNAVAKTDPGTGHGMTASHVCAGLGATGGLVVGGLMHNPALTEISAFNSVKIPGGDPMGIGLGLPIDLKTGRPSPNGKFTFIENLFPTMCSLFGISVPAQQVTPYGPVKLLVKG